MKPTTAPAWSTLKVVIPYTIFGCLWIWGSDHAVLWFTRSPDQIAWISMLKGWFYVGVTSLLLFFLVWRRLSDQQALHAKLENRQQELNEFLYAMSHHLRAPLVNMDGFAQELLECQSIAENHETCRESVEQIQRGAKEMDRILKSLARLHRTLREHPKPVSIPIEVTLRHILDRLLKQQPDRSVKMIVEGKSNVFADPIQFDLMMGEVLHNAIQHGWKNPELVIHVHIIKQFRSCIIEIKDQGAGFQIERLEDFVQPVLTTQSNSSGVMRMGLAIAWRCARWNEGRLNLHSTPGQGTTVRVELPR